MFGTAANNGQMIAEISANHRTTKMFLQIAQRLTGRGETKKPQGSFLSPIIRKLRGRPWRRVNRYRSSAMDAIASARIWPGTDVRLTAL